MERNDIFAASDNGVVKGYNLQTSSGTTYTKISEMEHTKSVVSMIWKDEDENDVLYANKSGNVSLLNISTGEITKLFSVESSHSLVALENMESNLFTGDSDGNFFIHSKNGILKDSFDLKTRLEVIKKVTDNEVAFGGQDINLRVFDLESRKETFTAKNPKNDWLNLRVHVRVTGLDVFSDPTLVAACSQSGLVEVWDRRENGKSPQIGFEPVSAKNLTAIDILDNQNEVVLGDSTGDVLVVDIRRPKNVIKYRGGRGCVKKIQHIGDCIGVASLDRFLRLWKVGSRFCPVKEFYSKARLTCILMRSEWTTEWDGLENVD